MALLVRRHHYGFERFGVRGLAQLRTDKERRRFAHARRARLECDHDNVGVLDCAIAVDIQARGNTEQREIDRAAHA